MTVSSRYAHTNIVARDWRRLARFYQELFGCQPVGPQRKSNAPWVEALTGVPEAAIEGIHLRLPGYGDNGPTLEIFQYNLPNDRGPATIHQPGFAHIAFVVDNVQQARLQALAAGAQDVGEVVTTQIERAGTITVHYMTDPEGNIFELQHWYEPAADNEISSDATP